MPHTTERQRRFMGAELARAERGESTETGMSREQLKHFARRKRAKRRRAHTGTQRQRRQRRSVAGG